MRRSRARAWSDSGPSASLAAGGREGSRCEAARDATSEAYSSYVERGATEPTKQMGPYRPPGGRQRSRWALIARLLAAARHHLGRQPQRQAGEEEEDGHENDHQHHVGRGAYRDLTRPRARHEALDHEE